MKRWWVFAPFLAVAGACSQESYSPFSQAQIDFALDVANDYTDGNLRGHVQALVDARAADPEAGTYTGGQCGKEEDCKYSRRQAAQAILAFWGDAALNLPAPQSEIETWDGFTTHNISLEFRGSEKPDEIVLLMAHYDAWFSGANDNGSGTAIVLEAARSLRGFTPRRTIRLLLVDGEELGLIGSGRYVARHGADNIHVALNLDMIGQAKDFGKGAMSPAADRDLLLLANEEAGESAFQIQNLDGRLPNPLKVESWIAPGRGVSSFGLWAGLCSSDHAQFWLQAAPGITAVRSVEAPAGYHTAADAVAGVDYALLDRIGRLFVAAAAAFSWDQG